MAFRMVEQRRQIECSLHMLLGRRFVLEVNCEEQVIPVHEKHSIIFGVADMRVLGFDVEFFFVGAISEG